MCPAHKYQVDPKQPAHLRKKIHEQKEKAALDIIAGLNALIARAGSSRLGTASRILHTAKEDIVYWVVEKSFHETPAEQFINEQLYSSGTL